MSDPQSARRVLATRYGIAFALSALLMVVGVVTVNFVISHEFNKIKRVKVATAPPPQQGANYLVIGSDTRAFVENQGEAEAFGDEQSEGGQRSDTMMVIHVEPGAKRTLVVSFPRRGRAPGLAAIPAVGSGTKPPPTEAPGTGPATWGTCRG